MKYPVEYVYVHGENNRTYIFVYPGSLPISKGERVTIKYIPKERIVSYEEILGYPMGRVQKGGVYLDGIIKNIRPVKK